MYENHQDRSRRSPRPQTRQARLDLESLERRIVPDAGTTIQANLLGHLTIEGTNFPDQIIIRHINGRFSIDGVQIRYHDTYLDSVSDLQVGRIYINGYEGDDVIIFDEGNGLGNSISNDTYINGHGGNDLLVGGAAWTQITGGDGNDIIRGGGSRDWLYGDAGDDAIYGDSGDDFIFGGTGRNHLFGGSGNDDISAGPIGDVIYGDSGDDILREGIGPDILNGGSGNDQIYIGRGGDWAFGGSGNDWFGWGGTDRDVVFGGTGNDRIFGGGGNDLLVGGAGNDTIYGDAGNDRIYGGPGRDYIYPAPGRDYVSKDGDLAVTTAQGLKLQWYQDALVINGTTHNDNIEVTRYGNQLYINGLAVTIPSTMKRIVVKPLAGIDLIDLQSVKRGGDPLGFKVTVQSSLGTDTVLTDA